MSVIYGRLPQLVGRYDEIALSEVMYYLYLPVYMKGQSISAIDIRLPNNVECCRPAIESTIGWAADESRYFNYVYLSARKGWASPDNPLNRPGWHCDGFGTNDLNFIWWDGPGTRFANQHFEGIVSDHNRSLKQFDEQVKDKYIVDYPQHHLYCIDSSVVHSTPIIQPPGCMRQYIKISLSDHAYNLENNSHNHLFEYNWPLHSRASLRNDPHRAQADFVEEG